jgi:hypothetical protein
MPLLNLSNNLITVLLLFENTLKLTEKMKNALYKGVVELNFTTIKVLVL